MNENKLIKKTFHQYFTESLTIKEAILPKMISVSNCHPKMKLLLTILVLVQTISLSFQNYDTRCFDSSFPSVIKEGSTRSSGATIDVRVVHRRRWTGSTGSTNKIVKDQVYTILENDERQLSFQYKPTPSSNPDYNPRILTLLFDSNSTSVKAAIGELREEGGPSYGTHSAEWDGCLVNIVYIVFSSQATTLQH